jgi:hypothetical protein
MHETRQCSQTQYPKWLSTETNLYLFGVLVKIIVKFSIYRIHIEESRAGRGIALIFEAIETKDKGNYICKATVDGKEVQASFTLIVISMLS